ncbi:MAG: aminotransferase class V-fold PLP-dependent enzyme [Gammaproteobacteria bacterium]|nr:aminotransferase class V-fold PLP-dependent enzyme [Gammaproteobacteria bacterium]
MEDPTLSAARAQFPSAKDAIHFDHASVGPISLRAAGAMQKNAEEHAMHGFDPGWRDVIEHVRSQVAWLVGSRTTNIAFVQNTSAGLSIAANGIDWRDGDNLVIPAQEFPSNYYPWLNLESEGIELRKVAAGPGHASIDDISAAIDSRTRLVTVSAVQYSNGYRYDLSALGELCSERGVLLVVDGTQAVGALGIDVGACGIDFLAVSSHKWMLGPPGIGFVHFSDRALASIRPSVVGWLSVADPFAFDYQLDLAQSAKRFEPGTENVIGTVGLGGTISLLQEFGLGWVEERVLRLTDYVCQEVSTRGFRVHSPRIADTGSGIVIFSKSDVDPQTLHARLSAAGVKCAVRAGGIRFSPHYYNTEIEIDAAIAALG